MNRPLTVRAAHWVPLEFAKNARTLTKTPKHINLNGTKRALFWDTTNDVPMILDDTCRHRGASLSAGGLIQADGCVKCKYHGHPTKASSSDLMVSNDIVWMRDEDVGSLTSDQLLPPNSWEFHDPEQRSFMYQRAFAGCNPVLVVENTLDWSHLDTVHAFHLIDGRPEVTIVRTGYNGLATYAYESKVFDLVIENEWVGPWNTCLRFIFDGRQSFTIHFAVRPDGVNDATLFVRVTRQDHKWMGILGDFMYMAINELPLIEDRYIVKNTDASQWSTNKLTKNDAFLQHYRAFMMKQHPDILDAYIGSSHGAGQS